MSAVIPAVLGWKNPDDDGSQLRLYALDKGPGPRWSKDSPTGRTIELAAQVDGNEGHRYLLVHLGDRYTDQAVIDHFAEHIEQIHAETFGDAPASFGDAP